MNDDGSGIRARGEEALGDLAQALLENPLFSQALGRALGAGEKAVAGPEDGARRDRPGLAPATSSGSSGGSARSPTGSRRSRIWSTASSARSSGSSRPRAHPRPEVAGSSSRPFGLGPRRASSRAATAIRPRRSASASSGSSSSASGARVRDDEGGREREPPLGGLRGEPGGLQVDGSGRRAATGSPGRTAVRGRRSALSSSAPGPAPASSRASGQVRVQLPARGDAGAGDRRRATTRTPSGSRVPGSRRCRPGSRAQAELGELAEDERRARGRRSRSPAPSARGPAAVCP